MYKSIFVPTAGFASDPAALATALQVARIFGGHLDCSHVHPDPAQIVAQAAGYGWGMGAGTAFAVGDIITAIQDEDRNRADLARRTFDAFCQRENLERVDMPPCARHPTASWSDLTGRELDILVSQTRIHDLTVIGYPSQGESRAREVASALLVGGGRPLLLAPEKAPTGLGRTIAVAWKDTPEAARAVAAAMPFLAQASQVVLINIAEHESVTIESVEALARTLRWHDIETQVRYLAHDCGTIPDTINTISKEEGADMLVMGGYGHSRVREFIFGGFTRHVLAGPELPVLMMH